MNGKPEALAQSKGYLRIGDVAALVGISASSLRAWEKLGLLAPVRSGSHYRLYTPQHVKILKRALYLRRQRGLNPPAIIHLLKASGMLHSTTPQAGVSPGRRLRALRCKAALSLADVAGSVGISAGFLSAVERGQMSASVGTLRKLARFYNISILDFFGASAANPRLVRPPARKLLQAGPGVQMELLAWGNAVMEPHLFRIAPGAGSGEPYSHQGEEFLFVLKGQISISIDDGQPVTLRKGDSFYFESNMPHRWENRGTQEAEILWVNTPPTF